MSADPFEALVVRDPLHGFIGLSERERTLIDSLNFRRLSRIHQLSHSHLVYPGAVHTRFEHSLGTLYVAGRIARRLDMPPEQQEIVRVAALLHDVGHGPYSHLFETVLDAAGVKVPEGKQLHEIITQGIIENDPTLDSGLSGIRSDVARILSKDDGLNSRILSGALDADKLDYLRRDSLFTGVSYGNFDLERILRSVCSVSSARELYLAVEWKAKDSLENYRLARYSMHTQVYEHKARLAADDMFTRSVVLALEEKVLDGKLLHPENLPDFLPAFQSLDDSSVVMDIFRNSRGRAGKLMTLLRERRLVKLAYQLPLTKEYVKDKGARKTLRDLQVAELRKIEAEFATTAGCDPDLVFVHPQDIKLKLYGGPEEAEEDEEGAASLLIKRTDGTTTSLADESPISSLPTPLLSVLVFCPKDCRKDVYELAKARFGSPGVFLPKELRPASGHAP